MTDNPLIAPTPPDDPTTIPPIDEAVQCVQACQNGDWVSGSLSGVSGGMEVLGAVLDPVDALIGWGVSWLLAHVEPFPTWMDQLCGDPETIRGFADTWFNVSNDVLNTSTEVRDEVTGASSEWVGALRDGYVAAGTGLSVLIEGFSAVIAGVGAATELAGGVVGTVRSFVEKALSEIVAAIGNALWKFLSVVLAPDAIRSLTTKVATLAGQIGRFVDDLVTSMGRLGELLRQLDGTLETITPVMKRLHTAWEQADVKVIVDTVSGMDEGPEPAVI